MQILTAKNLLLSTSALFILGACASTTPATNTTPEGCVLPEVDDGEGGCFIPAEGRGAVTTGTTDGEMSSNNLPFAIGPEDIVENDLDIPVLKMRAVRLEYLDEGVLDGDWFADFDEASVSAKLEDVTVTNLTAGIDGDWVVNITFGDGENLLINLDGDAGAISSDGLTYWYYSNTKSDYVMYFELWSESDQDDDGEYHLDAIQAMTGFEADPDLLALKGIGHYDGTFDTEGVSPDQNAYFWADGDIEIEANFAEASIEGDLDGSVNIEYGPISDSGDFVVTFEGEISGNGWTASSTGDTNTFANSELSEDAVQLDGVFYGPIGEETAGTILIDGEALLLDGDVVVGSAEIVGSGTFFAEEFD